MSGIDQSELFAVMVPSAEKQVDPTVAHAPDRLSMGTGVAAVDVPAAVCREMS